ncbi:MAG: site-specific integrase [Thiothrix sp.]|nr:site-specific integrase [Thiothrix sp.]HPE60853.1 site-specific integrase [Thiolinea sp.]
MKVSPLRQRMLDVLQLNGFSPRTVGSYIHAVEYLTRYYRRSPDSITPDEVQHWLLWLLKERGVSASTCRLYFNGVRFLYVQVLADKAFSEYRFTLPKLQQRQPDLLTRAEVDALIHQPAYPVHRLMLQSCYACGLRVSELVSIRVKDIDGERRLLHVVQGKGHKDRYVPIPASLLTDWRVYWQRYRPIDWLFPGLHNRRLSVTQPQRVYVTSKRALGIRKHGGIHSLRHAFATHSLQAGMPVHQLQRILGHANLGTTSCYVHWLEDSRPDGDNIDLLAGLGGDSPCSG